MFEQEITSIKDKITEILISNGQYYFLRDILRQENIPDFFKQFLWAEVRRWVDNEYNQQIQSTQFDFSDDVALQALAQYKVIALDRARFTFPQINELLDSAVKSQLNFLIRPRTTLKWFVYRNKTAKRISDIIMRLQYFYDYQYFLTEFTAWAEQTNSLSSNSLITIGDFEKEIEQIENSFLMNLSAEQFVDVLTPLFDFFQRANEVMYSDKIPSTALYIFLEEKKISQISSIIAQDIEQNAVDYYTKNDIFLLLENILREISIDGTQETQVHSETRSKELDNGEGIIHDSPIEVESFTPEENPDNSVSRIPHQEDVLSTSITKEETPSEEYNILQDHQKDNTHVEPTEATQSTEKYEIEHENQGNNRGSGVPKHLLAGMSDEIYGEQFSERGLNPKITLDDNFVHKDEETPLPKDSKDTKDVSSSPFGEVKIELVESSSEPELQVNNDNAYDAATPKVEDKVIKFIDDRPRVEARPTIEIETGETTSPDIVSTEIPEIESEEEKSNFSDTEIGLSKILFDSSARFENNSDFTMIASSEMSAAIFQAELHINEYEESSVDFDAQENIQNSQNQINISSLEVENAILPLLPDPEPDSPLTSEKSESDYFSSNEQDGNLHSVPEHGKDEFISESEISSGNDFISTIDASGDEEVVHFEPFDPENVENIENNKDEVVTEPDHNEQISEINASIEVTNFSDTVVHFEQEISPNEGYNISAKSELVGDGYEQLDSGSNDRKELSELENQTSGDTPKPIQESEVVYEVVDNEPTTPNYSVEPVGDLPDADFAKSEPQVFVNDHTEEVSQDFSTNENTELKNHQEIEDNHQVNIQEHRNDKSIEIKDISTTENIPENTPERITIEPENDGLLNPVHQTSYPSLVDVIKKDLQAKIVKKIFAGKEELYKTEMQHIDQISVWKEAMVALDKLYIQYEVDPYSNVALELSEIVYNRYVGK